MSKTKQKKTRQEINEESRLLKRKRKHKGLPSGSRINDGQKESNSNGKKIVDPRIGSKKPVPLVAEEVSTQKRPVKAPKVEKQKVSLTPEMELALLENDPDLEQLLDLVEQDKKLTPAQQKDLDKKLNRIEVLMNELGYSDDEFDDDLEQKKDDIVGLLKQK